MRLGVLTSSRADYSIYTPLLRRIREHTDWHCGLLVFGTHLSSAHGCTISAIRQDGFSIDHTIETMPLDDSPGGIARAMGKTMDQFSHVWEQDNYDLLIALGDRFEMFAAVASAVPFNLKVAHISGGETTLGAIDDAFRHSISHMSWMHFAAAEPYRQRLVAMLGHDRRVHNTGALAVDTLCATPWLSREEFRERWGIDLDEKFILITVHPETVSYECNREHMVELGRALEELRDYHLVITMPNADTMGNLIREHWTLLSERHPHVTRVENFGTRGYLTAMHRCEMMLGNTSSGFVEAEFFPKPVINLGERQRGRILTPNIQSIPFERSAILGAVRRAEAMTGLVRSGLYGDGHAAERMVRQMAEGMGVPLKRVP